MIIKVFIADDHAMMREGVRRILAGADDIRVVLEAADGDEVLAHVGGVDCDVLILDMTMPGAAGVDLIKQIKKSRPQLPVLILSMHNVGKIVAAALQAGANGYLTKDSDPDQLVDVIRLIAGGGRYVDPALAQKLAFDGSQQTLPHERLSEREYQVFLLLVEGKSTNLIASELFLSAKTVSTHKKRILDKMNAESTAELVRYAMRHHLTALHE